MGGGAQNCGIEMRPQVSLDFSSGFAQKLCEVSLDKKQPLN
jgi:hypothetical protein